MSHRLTDIADHDGSYSWYSAAGPKLGVRMLSKGMLIDIAAAIDVTLAIASALLIKLFYVDSSGAELAVSEGYLNYLSVIGLVTASLFIALAKRGHYRYSESDIREYLHRSNATRLCGAVFLRLCPFGGFSS